MLEICLRGGIQFMVARVSMNETCAVERREALMEASTISGRGNRNYDVAPDGRGFLVLRSTTPPRLVVRVSAFSGEVR